MSRVVETPEGRYVERAKPGHPGVIERTWLDHKGVCRVGPSPLVVESARRPRIRRSSSSPRVEVELTPKAHDVIRRMAFWQTGNDGLETGGGLFGVNAGDYVLVTHANPPGHLAKREHAAVQFDASALRHWDPRDDDVTRIGCWHTHPVSADGTPSGERGDSGDLVSWRAGLERMEGERWQPFYLGLILTGERGWAKPTLHAWVLDKTGALERATVREPR